MYKLNNLIKINKENRFTFYMMLSLAIYIVVYSTFLYVSDFLPYVFDNNETYSSLVHAYNMYFGDWGNHFGLADEAFSPDPAAHPIVHTHQGNWPRILAFILFAVGARSAESQIFIHVFSIGLISIWLMHRFFAKITNNSFAFIVSLTFMTDYLLFAQWQVVTYRVWHVFFVFASLNCMHEIDGPKRIWKYLFIANFAALFYWELVFAFYVSLWALLYYAYQVSWDFKRVFKKGLLISASGTSSLLILVTQLSMFMGFKNVLLDYYYTFFARNATGSEVELKQKMQDFYGNMDVVFWYNIIDVSKFKNINEFFRQLFAYVMQVHTPVLSLQVIFAFLSITICSLQVTINRIFSTVLSKEISFGMAKKLTMVSFMFFMVALFFDNILLGVLPSYEFYERGSILSMIMIPVFSWFIATCIFNICNPFKNKVKLEKVLLICLFMVFCTWLVYTLPQFYVQNQSAIWFKYLNEKLSTSLWRFISITTVFLGATNIALTRDLIKINFKTKAIFAFLSAAVLAYVVVYLLSPGYIYSGYLVRTAPFVVFFIDVVVALFFWFMITSVYMQLKLNKSYNSILLPIKSGSTNKFFMASFMMLLVSISSVVMLGLISFQWFNIQYSYYKIFPPTSMTFIKQLRKPEFQGKSIITNQYPLPFSYEAYSWGYNGTNFGAGELSLNNEGYSMSHEIEYLWYKNRDVFPDYKKPDYYVCFAAHSFDTAVNELNNFSQRSRRCSCDRIVSQSILSTDFTENDLRLRHKLLMRDEFNHDAWAIVKMDWEFPPHFAKIKNTQRHFDVKYDKSKQVLKINYAFKQQDGIQEKFSKFKIVHNYKGKKTILHEVYAKNGTANIKLSRNLPGTIEIIGLPCTENKSGVSISEMLNMAIQ